MTKNYRFLLLFFALLAGMSVSYAQDDAAKEKELLEKQVNEFAKTYANLTSTKNPKAVLRFFSKDLSSNIYVFNISGRSRVQNSDYSGFEAYLNHIIRTTGIEIGYDMVKIQDIHVSGKNATVIYKVNYETKVPNGIWVKGTEVVTLACEKKGDQWFFVHYDIVQFEDEKLKGTCLCELFIAESDDGEVVSKTTIPTGRDYATKFDNFEFRTVSGDQVIKVQDQVYRRLKTGPVIAVKGDEEVQLGISNSKKETVLMIIAEDLYGDSCAKLKTKE